MKKMSSFKPLYPGVKLSALIVSDTHIDCKHPLPALPKYWLRSAAKDAEKSSRRQDAFITVGDTTSRGSDKNWQMVAQALKKRNPANNMIFAIGNHDCWSDSGFDAAVENFYAFSKQITGNRREKPYFAHIINGYHFVFLGTDSDAGCEAQISDEQMSWFASEMEKAGASGKPVFVFCHQSLNGRHGLPRTWSREEKPDRDPAEGGIGERSEEVAAILKKYKNVFYFSGHSHMGLCGENKAAAEGYSSFEYEDGVWLINLPSLACGNHHGEVNTMGMGVVLEVYDGKVVIRPRFTSTHRWNKNVAIKDGKPYLEQIIE